MGAALRSAAVGGALLALIEGVGILLTKYTAEQIKPNTPVIPLEIQQQQHQQQQQQQQHK